MKKLLSVFLLSFLAWLPSWAGNETQPVADLVNRVCGTGAADHFSFQLNPQLSNGKEAFQLGYANGKVTVTGSSLSALTTGLNWYLKHDAHVHISWNNLTEKPASYPVPKDKQVHASASEFRYYLNYCTFSYSMSMWDEDRWMKELDWMALHGINLPLQIVGIDAVWYEMLTKDFHFTHDQANEFIVGPAFQGWWLMNNIVKLGGPNPEWWYKRSASLGKKITDRMRELGMKPCLPGFVGMVPRKYVEDNKLQSFKMEWCNMQSPDILVPTQTEAFNKLAEKYYERIIKVYGFAPEHYSLDPIHEHALPQGMTPQHYKDLCDNARKAMDTWGVPKGKKGLWVAQEWQTNADQHRIDALPSENTLLLDLASERLSYVDRFGTHPYLFCMLHNYGGNIGLFGRIADMIQRYQMHVTKHSNILRGVGATPEGIETNPVLYDLLFELPWLQQTPDAQAWLNEYTECRYGINSPEAKDAWSNLLVTLYQDVDDQQQGCREPVFCARPNLDGNDASQWAYADFDWDKSKVIRAAYQMIAANGTNANYTYDMVDIVRQALSDYGHTLQMDMKATSQKEGFQSSRFDKQSQAFLGLIDDLDAFLGTISDFRVGRFTEDARRIATENKDAGQQDWLEHNIRMLFSTWGENGEILDYANREYQGMMADYYKPRWVRYFEDLKKNGNSNRDYLNEVERPWMNGEAANAQFGKYKAAAENTSYGDAKATAKALMDKYFGTVKGGSYYTALTNNDLTATLKVAIASVEDLNHVFERLHTGASIASYAIDLNQDGVLDEEKSINTPLSIPAMAANDVKARVILNDGTRIDFLATIGKELAQGRLVCASTNDPALGTVNIKGSTTNGIFSKGAITLSAQPIDHSLFLGWIKKDLSWVSANNPFVYADASSESFQACFGKNVWKKVESAPEGVGETKDHSAYIMLFEYSINKGEFLPLYTANTAPDELHQRITQPIPVKAGDELTIRWTAGNGMNYCFLTAYVDDAAGERGTFNNCFYKHGNHGGQCADLLNHSATYKVSPNIKEGMTTLRLRFDGAWNNHGSWDEANGRFTADGMTNRPVYDFTLIVGKPSHTAVFDRFNQDGWEVACQETGENTLALTGAWHTGNQTKLNVPASVQGTPLGSTTVQTYQVVSLDEKFFSANPNLTEITLPASLQKIGNAASYQTVAENKNGNQQTLELGTTLSEDAWSIEADVKMPATALNAWGSCILASGNNAFDGPFETGFQLYLYAPNHSEGKKGLCIKTKGNVETIMEEGEIFDLYGKEVKMKLSYTTDKLVCSFTSGQEHVQKEVNCTIKNVSQLTWAMQPDALFHSIRYAQTATTAPVADMIAPALHLQAIHVEKGNKHYSSEDGVLYDATQTLLLAVPTALQGTVNLPATFKGGEGKALDANQQVFFRVAPAHYATLRTNRALPAHRASVDLSQDWDATTFAQNVAYLGTDVLGEVTLSNRQPSVVNWNTLCLPFALTEAEAQTIFAETYVLNKVIAINSDAVTLVFDKASANDVQQAGQPLLVKMNEGKTLTFHNKAVTEDVREVKVMNDAYQAVMVGNFDFRQLKNQEFFINQNKFYFADVPVNLRGYRAHIQLHTIAPMASMPRELLISTDGAVTSIGGTILTPSETEASPIYTLDGRRISNGQAKKGVFIKNHQKIIR